MTGYLDIFLFYVRCLRLFHRWTRTEIGWPYDEYEVCTRCGAKRDDR